MKRLQIWIADRGYGQYPLPRRSLRPEPVSLTDRWVKAMVTILWVLGSVVIVGLGLMALYICVKLLIFITPLWWQSEFGH